MPKISIITIVYNGEKYLAQALDSALRQTFQDFEIVVYYDGSTDNTLRILQEYAQRDRRIRIITECVNKGVLSALNQAILHAGGEFIVRLDADDMIHPRFLEDALTIQQMENYDHIIFGNIHCFMEDGTPAPYHQIRYKSFKYFGEQLFQVAFPHLASCRIAISSRLIRRSVILPVLFLTEYRYRVEDIFHAAPIFAESKRFAYINNVTPYYYYRQNSGQWNSNRGNDTPEFFDSVCKSYHDAFLYWVNYLQRMNRLDSQTFSICAESCELDTAAKRVRLSSPENYEANLAIFHKYFCKGDALLADSQRYLFPLFVQKLEAIIRR